MFFKCKVYIFLIVFLEVTIYFGYSYVRRNGRRQNNVGADTASDDEASSGKSGKTLSYQKTCWMRIDSKKHFAVMDKLDERYADVRKAYQDAAKKDNLDQQMLEVLVQRRGVAERELQATGGRAALIPAGINLGGYFIMRMPSSLLFFHRLKLRNHTYFTVTHLQNDLANLTLHARLSLNDLHLQGSFDRTSTDKDPSVLFYTPTYGQVEFLLKNVQYTFEGRYRLLKDRFTIELIISDVDFDDAMMTYLSGVNNTGMRLQRKNIDEFLIRLKCDLDKWVKDYFNDYLMYFGLVDKKRNNKYQQYDKKRAKELNAFTDQVIDVVIQRLHKVKAETVELPKFTIFTSHSMELLLRSGELRGLDSIYRRSVATGKKESGTRKVDAVVGFSNLKVTYQYEALLATNAPIVTGMIVLSADELTARMGVTVAKDTDTVDLQFQFLEQAKPESLTIEGAANRMISNFKYILEQHIIALMTNTLHYNIQMLSSLSRCIPQLHSQFEANNIAEEDEYDDENEPSATGDYNEAMIKTTTDGQLDNQTELSPASITSVT